MAEVLDDVSLGFRVASKMIEYLEDNVEYPPDGGFRHGTGSGATDRGDFCAVSIEEGEPDPEGTGWYRLPGEIEYRREDREGVDETDADAVAFSQVSNSIVTGLKCMANTDLAEAGSHNVMPNGPDNDGVELGEAERDDEDGVRIYRREFNIWAGFVTP